VVVVVHLDLDGLAGRLPFGPAVGVVADQFLFLVSTLTTGCPAARYALAWALR
jgi:hypothetical protein